MVFLLKVLKNCLYFSILTDYIYILSMIKKLHSIYFTNNSNICILINNNKHKWIRMQLYLFLLPRWGWQDIITKGTYIKIKL